MRWMRSKRTLRRRLQSGCRYRGAATAGTRASPVRIQRRCIRCSNNHQRCTAPGFCEQVRIPGRGQRIGLHISRFPHCVCSFPWTPQRAKLVDERVMYPERTRLTSDLVRPLLVPTAFMIFSCAGRRTSETVVAFGTWRNMVHPRCRGSALFSRGGSTKQKPSVSNRTFGCQMLRSSDCWGVRIPYLLACDRALPTPFFAPWG